MVSWICGTWLRSTIWLLLVWAWSIPAVAPNAQMEVAKSRGLIGSVIIRALILIMLFLTVS